MYPSEIKQWLTPEELEMWGGDPWCQRLAEALAEDRRTLDRTYEVEEDLARALERCRFCFSTMPRRNHWPRSLRPPASAERSSGRTARASRRCSPRCYRRSRLAG